MSLVEPQFADRRSRVNDRLQLWIDGVGGFMVLLADRVFIGQAMVTAQVDIPVMGDISRRHAAIRRSGDEYILDPFSDVTVNQKSVTSPALLKREDMLQLGRGVKFTFSQPHPLSNSATLALTSPHRTEPVSDGIVLLADSMLVGPKSNNHIVCSHWNDDLVFFRLKNRLHVKSSSPLLPGQRPGQSERFP